MYGEEQNEDGYDSFTTICVMSNKDSNVPELTTKYCVILKKNRVLG